MQESSNSPVYLWQVAGKPVSVLVNVDIVDRLAAVVDEGYRSNSWRGTEVGGLLLGRSRSSRGQTVVEVTEFEPIESEHAAGPSLLLSEPDRKALEPRLAKRRPQLSVVGFYRSHTRREPGIEVEDVALFSTYFAKASNVFLLIRPRSGGPPMAGFLMWEGGKIRTATPSLEFPLSKQMLVARGEVNEPVRTAAPTPEPVDSPKPAPEKTRPASSPRPNPVPASAVPARVIPAAAALEHAPAPAAASPRRVTARTRGALKWAAAGVVMAAALVSGVLSRTTPPVPAPEPDLASSAARDSTADTSYSLPAAPPATEPTASAPPAPAPEDVASLEPPVATMSVPAPAPPKVSAAARWARAHSKGSSQRAAQHRKLAYAATASRPALRLLPEPPSADPPPSVSGDLPVSGGVPLSGDSAGDPFCRVTVVRASHSRVARAFARLFKHSAEVPPAPLNDPTPLVPPDVRQRISSAVDIDVRVLVAATGEVQDVEVVSKDKDPALADLALYASRRSEFTPARADGQNVPGEVVLRYRFGADDQ